MKVYPKNEDKKGIIVGFIVGVVLLSFVGFLIYHLIWELKKGTELHVAILNDSIAIAFAFAFIICGGMIIYYIFKPAKKYKAILLKKEKEKYNNNEVWMMKFKVYIVDNNEEEIIEVEGYTLEDNNYKVNNNYIVGVKEANWSIRYIEELDEKNYKSNKGTSFNPLFISLLIVFMTILFVSILGMIMYPQYLVIYIITALFASVPLYFIAKNMFN